MSNFNPLIKFEQDDLIIPEVGQWSEEKYRLLGYYCDIFTTSMRTKWDELVYIDLFAGSGVAELKNNKNVVMGSPLIAMSIPIPFTKYIFCEQDAEKREALAKRIDRLFPNADYTVIEGDANNLDTIKAIKKVAYKKGKTVLSFCFVDPYSLDLNFSTIESLSNNFYVDFLILLAFGMDANRNLSNYLSEQSKKIERFLNCEKWREEFKDSEDIGDFCRFLSKKYDKNMKDLNYAEPSEKHPITNTKNRAIYHLGFYSRHPLGNKFWNEVKKYSNPQQKLF